jgi:hypothetical protein
MVAGEATSIEPEAINRHQNDIFHMVRSSGANIGSFGKPEAMEQPYAGRDN